MADTPEAKAKRKVRSLITETAQACKVGVKLRSNAAGGIGFASGTADFTLYWRIGNRMAITIDIEVKAQDNTATRLQEQELMKMVAAGCHGLVIWGDDHTDMAWLRRFLSVITHDTPPRLKLHRAEPTGEV